MVNDGTNSFFVLLVLMFVALLLLLEALYLLWQAWRGPQAQRMKARMRTLVGPSGNASVLRQRHDDESWAIGRLVAGLPGRHSLARLVLQSGLHWPVPGLLLASLALGLLSFLALLQPGILDEWVALLLAAGISLLPLAYVRHQRDRRMARIGSQLPDALDLITRAMRAGHAFTAGLKMAGEELSQPIAGELRSVHEEVSFGIDLDQALSHLCERVPLADMRFFTIAVLIQRESGGKLTEVLSNLSELIRQRGKLLARVRVLSSEGRLSAWILGLMPFVLGGVMTLLNPTFMSLLWTDPMGVTIIKTMLVLMAFGALMLRKISRIRV